MTVGNPTHCACTFDDDDEPVRRCMVHREMAERIAQLERLAGALRSLMEVIEVPDANCSCHINPPCNDCVEYGGLREAMEYASSVLKRVCGHE